MPSPVLARRLITPFRSKLLAEYAVNGFFGGITTSRATDLWLPNASGVLTQYGSGEVGIVDGDAVWCQPAATNKNTNYNANPTDLTNVSKGGSDPSNAVLSVVDDSTAISDAGLDNVCTSGMVYKLDNSAGSATAFIDFGGATGNTNTHWMSCYVRGDSNSIRLNARGAGALGASGNITANADYERLDGQLIPAGAGNIFGVQVPAGATAFAILNQLEESAFVTPVIPTAGSSVAVDASEPKYAEVSGLTNNIAGRLYWKPLADDQGTVWILGNYTDANNGWGILHDGTNLIFRNRVSGSNNDATVALNYVVDTEYRIDYRLAENGLDIAVDGTKGTTDSTTTDLTNATNSYYGQDGNDSGHCLCTIREHTEKKIASNFSDAEWLA